VARKAVCAETTWNEKGLCCTNGVGDSSREFSVIAVSHEQLVPDEVPDKELAFI